MLAQLCRALDKCHGSNRLGESLAFRATDWHSLVIVGELMMELTAAFVVPEATVEL